MSRVELYERIRKDSRDQGLSIRALAQKHHVHRRTVREALTSAVPPGRKTPERDAPALGPWMMVIRAWLVADREVPRKQRHTARRVWQRLVAEYGAQVAESTVRAYVAQVNFELDNTLRMVTVPQTHGPGEEAECDFGEFMAWIEGVLVKCWMFCLRLCTFGPGVPCGVLPSGPGGVLRGARAGLRPSSGGAGPGPLRQSEGSGDQGAVGPGPAGERTLCGVALPLRLRQFLLPARHRGQPRERRRGGGGGTLPPPPSGPGSPGVEPGRVERADRRRRRPRRRASHRPASAAVWGKRRRSSWPGCGRCPKRRSTRPRSCRR